MNSLRKHTLLRLARASIAAQFGEPRPARPEPLPEWLAQPAAVFVSLHRHGELRGCVGSLQPQLPLFDEVITRAQSAAFSDPRVMPVQAHELDDLEIELSVLGPLEPVGATTPDDLLKNLRPGEDGLVLSSRTGSAVFIPSMWKQLPDPRSFVFHLLRKAGLHTWPSDLQAERFTAEVFASTDVEA
jgi:AmmeMemoRadiSam system protein A